MLRSIEVLTKLSTYSLNFYQELAQRQALKTNDIGFEKRGLLMVSATNDGLRHAELEMNLMSERGIAGRKLSKDDALDFEPSLRPLICLLYTSTLDVWIIDSKKNIRHVVDDTKE